MADIERNDCVVRAFACAVDSDYDNAHAFVRALFKRNPKQGTFGLSTLTTIAKNAVFGLGDKAFTVSQVPVKNRKNTYRYDAKDGKGKRDHVRNMTLVKFVQENNIGTFLVQVSKHALVVKDGVVMDNAGEEFRPTRKVLNAWEVNLVDKKATTPTKAQLEKAVQEAEAFAVKLEADKKAKRQKAAKARVKTKAKAKPKQTKAKAKPKKTKAKAKK